MRVISPSSKQTRPITGRCSRTWPARGPSVPRPGFCFDIKAYGLLTGHPVDQASLWDDLKEELSEEARSKRRIYAHHLPPDALEEAWAAP